MKITNEAQQIIISYCKNWYGTTGNIETDFRIILEDYYSVQSWSLVDICEVVLNNFIEIAKDNMRTIFNTTIFDRYELDREDVRIKFLKSLKSIIFCTEVAHLEGLDRSFKDKFNLKRGLR